MLLMAAYSYFFLFKQKTAYEMRISDWSSDVCSSDLQQRSPGNNEHDFDFVQRGLARQVPDFLHHTRFYPARRARSAPVQRRRQDAGGARLGARGDAGLFGLRRRTGGDVGGDRKSTRLNSSH